MNLQEMFQKDLVFLDIDAKNQDEVIQFVAEKLFAKKAISDIAQFVAEVKKREAQDSTAMGDGIAIPHVLNKVVNGSYIVFVRTKTGLDWKSMDEKPVDLIFFILTSGQDGDEHLQALGNLSKVLINVAMLSTLRREKQADKILAVFHEDDTPKQAVATSSTGGYDVVGITACPTGIAHTYLAQEKLIEYAKKMGLTAKIETQGRRGTEDRLTQEDVDNAKVIVLAHDKALNGLGRFDGKKVVEVGTKEAIFKGDELLQKALKGEGLKTISHKGKDDDGESDFSLKKFKDIKGNLLAGISRMLPFVVAGGIVLGIAFLIDFAAGTKGGGDFGTVNKAAGWFAALGKLSMQMMIPILGAYICYSLVGPQGLMPGMVCGLASSNIMTFAYGLDLSALKPDPETGVVHEHWNNLWQRLLPFESHESGFIGAIFGAYLAGFIVYGFTKLMKKFPRGLQGVRDIVFIPLLSLLATGLMMFVINIPLGYVMMELGKGITWLANHDLIVVVSLLFGVMMCFDMGGPINKIAYSLGVLAVGGQLVKASDGSAATGALLGQQEILMASALLSGMIPPLMIAMCTVIFPRAWSSKDRDAAKVNWAMGLCFVTEGAIPFMIKDPKRVSACTMVGGLICGILVGVLKISVGAPHGGIFVFPLMQTGMGNPNYELTSHSIAIGIVLALAILIGCSLLSAILLGFWRTASIKNGVLVLEESNGVREGYVARLEHLATKKTDPKYATKVAQLEKAEEKLNNKIAAYDKYAAVLKEKQLAHAAMVEKRAEEHKIKHDALAAERAKAKAAKVQSRKKA